MMALPRFPRLRRLLLNLVTVACILTLPRIAISHLDDDPDFLWIRHGNGVRIATSHPTAACLAALLPAARLIAYILTAARDTRREYRRTHFICLSCGYDLRHTPDRCPECGTLPPTSRLLPTE